MTTTIAVRPRTSPQEELGLVKPSFAAAYLSDEQARAIHMFCVDELQDATNRILMKLERRFAPLTQVVADLERQMRRINVERMGELSATISDVQVKMRDLQTMIDVQPSRPLHQTTPSFMKEDLKKQAAAARDVFSNSCAEIQIHLRDLKKACEEDKEAPASPSSQTVLNGIQAQIDRMESNVHWQGHAMKEMRKDMDTELSALKQSVAASQNQVLELETETRKHEADFAKQIQDKVEEEAKNVQKLRETMLQTSKSVQLMDALNMQKTMTDGLQGEIGKVEQMLDAFRQDMSTMTAEMCRIDQKVDSVEKELQLPEHRTPILWLSKRRIRKLPSVKPGHKTGEVVPTGAS